MNDVTFFVSVTCHSVHSAQLRHISVKEDICVIMADKFYSFSNWVIIIFDWVSMSQQLCFVLKNIFLALTRAFLQISCISIFFSYSTQCLRFTVWLLNEFTSWIFSVNSFADTIWKKDTWSMFFLIWRWCKNSFTDDEIASISAKVS